MTRAEWPCSLLMRRPFEWLQILTALPCALMTFELSTYKRKGTRGDTLYDGHVLCAKMTSGKVELTTAVSSK